LNQIDCLSIGVGAGKFLGVRRIFARISPNLPENNSEENDIQKNDCILIHLHFVKTKHFKHHFLPKFSQTCPKKTLKRHDLQRNVGFHTFWPNFHRFCPDFAWIFSKT